MSFNKYQKLTTLYPDKTEWKIRVRAQSVWEGINRTTMEFRGINVIFIDDDNCRIHALISCKIADFFKEELKEGKIYSLSNFHVRKYVREEKNRPIRFENHIYFDNYTEMVVENDNLTQIPSYSFDLFDLKDVDQFYNDGRYLIDVLGALPIKDMECVYLKEDDKTKCYLKFKITDGRKNLKELGPERL